MLQASSPSPSNPLSIGPYPPLNTYHTLPDPALPAKNDRQYNYADPANHLVVSPYTTLPHLLDLRTLDEPPKLLAKALTILQSVREDYATAPYHQSFNWTAVIDRLKSSLSLELAPTTTTANYRWKRQHFYIVVFRSQIPPTTDRSHLYSLDQKSHIEATKCGGLLKYWFGAPDVNGRNLATCIWRNSADARPASVGPGHREAMRATRDMYTEWRLERLKLEIDDGAGGWSITPWEDEEDEEKN